MVGRLLSYWVTFHGRAVKLREGNRAYFGLSSFPVIVITSIVTCFVANETFFLELLPTTGKADNPTCFVLHPSSSTEILGFNREPPTIHIYVFIFAQVILGNWHLNLSHLRWQKTDTKMKLLLPASSEKVHKCTKPLSKKMSDWAALGNRGMATTKIHSTKHEILGFGTGSVDFCFWSPYENAIPAGQDRWRSQLPLVLVYHVPENKSPPFGSGVSPSTFIMAYSTYPAINTKL